MNRRRLWAALLVLGSIGPIASAGSGGLGRAGPIAGPGFGGEQEDDFPPGSNVCFGIGSLPLRVHGAIGTVNYDFDLKVLDFPFTLDWYPFHGGFRLSGGLIFNQTDGDLDMHSIAALTMGGHSYSAADSGTIHGTVHFPRLAPYVGIGWGHTFGLGGRWGILGDLGMAFLGRPKVSLSAAGPLAADAKFIGDLAQEERDVQDDLSILRFYPVFSVSLFYRF